jgi:hypothetical protein
MFLMRESYHAGRKHVIDNANDKAIYDVRQEEGRKYN